MSRITEDLRSDAVATAGKWPLAVVAGCAAWFVYAIWPGWVAFFALVLMAIRPALCMAATMEERTYGPPKPATAGELGGNSVLYAMVLVAGAVLAAIVFGGVVRGPALFQWVFLAWGAWLVSGRVRKVWRNACAISCFPEYWMSRFGRPTGTGGDLVVSFCATTLSCACAGCLPFLEGFARQQGGTWGDIGAVLAAGLFWAGFCLLFGVARYWASGLSFRGERVFQAGIGFFGLSALGIFTVLFYLSMGGQAAASNGDLAEAFSFCVTLFCLAPWLAVRAGNSTAFLDSVEEVDESAMSLSGRVVAMVKAFRV